MRKYTWKICALLALVLICLLGTKERVMAYSVDSIRDCIAFPKNNSGRDVMLDAPAALDQSQLDELNLVVDIKEDK